MLEGALTVSKLNAYAAAILSRDPYLRNLRVKGELSGFKRHSSGHLYFAIKDEEASVRCVMFRQAAMALSFDPKDGMQVELFGYAAIYVRDGQFQLYVQEMQEDGQGELYRRFVQYKTRLEAQGYFDEARKRKPPFLPKCVGLVTAETGAAVQDMYHVIHRRFPGMPIVLYPVTVQGETAAGSISAGIQKANGEKKADVLIVGRGGGSMEDLWAFNEPEVAKAIYESHILVISAVGHETDFTIADFVADLRAPTPSAAAELCVPEYDALVQWLDTVQGRLEFARQQGAARKRERLNALLRAYGVMEVRHRLQTERQSLLLLLGQTAHSAQTGLGKKRERLNVLLGRLRALGPDSVMQRGYAMIEMEGGRYASSVEMLQPGDSVNIRMADGSAGARIHFITKNDRS